MLGKFSWVKGAVRTPKALFLSYCEYATLPQFTGFGPLRACPKFEGFSGVVVEKTSWWWMIGPNRLCP